MIYRVASANTPEGFENEINDCADRGYRIIHIYDPGGGRRYAAIMELVDEDTADIPEYEKWR